MIPLIKVSYNFRESEGLLKIGLIETGNKSSILLKSTLLILLSISIWSMGAGIYTGIL